MVKVYALIVTFKRKELLEKVVERILQQTFSPSKIIVIDNNSNDGTEEIIAKIKENSLVDIEYKNTGANLGGAGGFSYGFNYVINDNFDYLWIMDDDLLPEKNCLEKLLYSADDKTIVQPLRFNLDGTCAEYSPIRFDLSSPFLLHPKIETVKDRIESLHDDIIQIQGIPFEGPLIPKDIIEAVGIPDKRFFIFYDDLDYAIRARKAGFKIICKKDAVAYRLLMNNQVNDLHSWKGYFMLRNFFKIHYLHGENTFVKIRPVLLASSYILKEIFLLRPKYANICWHAFKDSLKKNFAPRKKYIP
ncbi:glycosyltransferase family 2 protein [Cronobacter turicensis]